MNHEEVEAMVSGWLGAAVANGALPPGFDIGEVVLSMRHERDVNILDNWAFKHRNKKAEWTTRYVFGEGTMTCECLLVMRGQKAQIFEGWDAEGKSFHAARAAAAAALLKSDPELAVPR